MNLFPIIIIGTGMVTVSLAFIVYARQKTCPWRYMGLGALAWIVTITIKNFMAVQIEPVVYRLLFVPDKLFAPGNILFYIYVGALTGITEVLLTWLLLRYTRLGHIPWSKVLAFGIGFGVFEALYLGFPYLISIITVLTNPQSITEAALANLQTLSSPIFYLAPIVERVGAIFSHIFTSALLFYGVVSKQARWFWVSFTFKTLLDAVVGFAFFWGSETALKLWTIEGILLLFGFVAWLGIRKLQLQYTQLKHL
jgi:uncharacterized membrane protein YhfC